MFFSSAQSDFKKRNKKGRKKKRERKKELNTKEVNLRWPQVKVLCSMLLKHFISSQFL